jgi:hypothetical protein
LVDVTHTFSVALTQASPALLKPFFGEIFEEHARKSCQFFVYSSFNNIES